MPYHAQSDIDQRIGPDRLIDLTDISSPPAGEVDGAVLAQALAATDAEIDAYLARRYGAPLSVVPVLVTELACTLTIERLHRYSVPDEIKDRAAAARRTLRDIADGRASLAELDIVAPAGAGSALYRDTALPVFSRATLADY